jgi:D-glycero-D-manno-heptose 1,7-bisphosphate phosphatase
LRISHYISNQGLQNSIMSTMQPALFLDRDGVIIENRENYVRSWEDVSFFPQALQALALASPTEFRIVIVTNQSAVGRGIISIDQALDINHKIVNEIERYGGRIDGIFMCPHAPQAGCDCRKPKPGLLFQAAEALSLDLQKSIMIGDALTDLAAGQAAGIPIRVLVMTGRGASQAQLPEVRDLEPFLTYRTLADALNRFIY